MDTIRHSVRSRLQPERLQHTHLGNPLISIVQYLFQGLTEQSFKNSPGAIPSSGEVTAISDAK